MHCALLETFEGIVQKENFITKYACMASLPALEICKVGIVGAL